MQIQKQVQKDLIQFGKVSVASSVQNEYSPVTSNEKDSDIVGRLSPGKENFLVKRGSLQRLTQQPELLSKEVQRSQRRKLSFEPRSSIVKKKIDDKRYGRVSKSQMKAVVEDIRKKFEPKDEDDPEVCSLCYENLPNVVFFPCYHGNVCRDCSLKFLQTNTHCPICRKRVRKLILTEPSSKKNIVQLKEDITPATYLPSESEQPQSRRSIEPPSLVGSLVRIPSPRLSPQMHSRQAGSGGISGLFSFRDGPSGVGRNGRPLIVPIPVAEEESLPSVPQLGSPEQTNRSPSPQRPELRPQEPEPEAEMQISQQALKPSPYQRGTENSGQFASDATLSRINEANWMEEESRVDTPLPGRAARLKKNSGVPETPLSRLSLRNGSFAEIESLPNSGRSQGSKNFVASNNEGGTYPVSRFAQKKYSKNFQSEDILSEVSQEHLPEVDAAKEIDSHEPSESAGKHFASPQKSLPSQKEPAELDIEEKVADESRADSHASYSQKDFSRAEKNQIRALNPS